MVQLKRNLLSVALASATMMLMAQAHAQTAQPAGQTEEEAAAARKKADDAKTLDKVEVVGIRSAIEKSIDTKQTSTSIVEAISAEDIGKLPDASIADSIARLPGLTAQRERGRAAQINIRGFAGDFSTATLNGREQASTGDNRGVELERGETRFCSAGLRDLGFRWSLSHRIEDVLDQRPGALRDVFGVAGGLLGTAAHQRDD